MKTAFIGGGNMAEAVVRGMLGQGMRDIVVAEPLEERRDFFQSRLGVKATADNASAVKGADIVVLAVKPQQMEQVLEEIGGLLAEEKTVVSIAAGVTLEYLGRKIKSDRLVRAMPNMAARVGEGMTVLSLCECLHDQDMGAVREIFMASGRVLVMPEKHMDAVTALSGSGPAFIALFVGAMAEFGVKAGLAEDHALELAVQTAVGASKILDGELCPEQLIKAVKSPGGTTAEGLKVFEEAGLAGIVERALDAARKRAGELAR